jgi:lipopolysaccharide export system protein LptA
MSLAFPSRSLLFFALLCATLSSLNAETFTFSADRVESVMAEGKEKTVLSGRAHVKSGTLDISADRIEISGKSFTFLDCSGGVIAVDDERGIAIDTPHLTYDRPTKFSHMEGASTLEDRKNKVVLKALWIENDGKTDVTVAQVTVRILKEKLACRAEYAIYRRADKTLELTGSPLVRKDGDEYRASRILVNTDTEEITLEGEVRGQITQANNGKDGSAAPGEPASQAAAPAPSSGTPSSGTPSGTAPADASTPAPTPTTGASP